MLLGVDGPSGRQENREICSMCPRSVSNISAMKIMYPAFKSIYLANVLNYNLLLTKKKRRYSDSSVVTALYPSIL